jgi:hypothetical protein
MASFYLSNYFLPQVGRFADTALKIAVGSEGAAVISKVRACISRCIAMVVPTRVTATIHAATSAGCQAINAFAIANVKTASDLTRATQKGKQKLYEAVSKFIRERIEQAFAQLRFSRLIVTEETPFDEQEEGILEEMASSLLGRLGKIVVKQLTEKSNSQLEEKKKELHKQKLILERLESEKMAQEQQRKANSNSKFRVKIINKIDERVLENKKEIIKKEELELKKPEKKIERLELIVDILEKKITDYNISILTKKAISILSKTAIAVKKIFDSDATEHEIEFLISGDSIRDNLLKEFGVNYNFNEFKKNTINNIRRNLQTIIENAEKISIHRELVSLKTEQKASIPILGDIKKSVSEKWVRSGYIKGWVAKKIASSSFIPNTLDKLCDAFSAEMTSIPHALPFVVRMIEDGLGDLLVIPQKTILLDMHISRKELTILNKISRPCSEVFFFYLIDQLIEALARGETVGLEGGPPPLPAVNLQKEWHELIDALTPSFMGLVERDGDDFGSPLTNYLANNYRFGLTESFLITLISNALKLLNIKNQVIVPLTQALQEAIHR